LAESDWACFARVKLLTYKLEDGTKLTA
jgi:hypothetical protein